MGERYIEEKAFIETNHRNPSRHNPEERFKYCKLAQAKQEVVECW